MLLGIPIGNLFTRQQVRAIEVAWRAKASRLDSDTSTLLFLKAYFQEEEAVIRLLNTPDPREENALKEILGYNEEQPFLEVLLDYALDQETLQAIGGVFSEMISLPSSPHDLALERRLEDKVSAKKIIVSIKADRRLLPPVETQLYFLKTWLLKASIDSIKRFTQFVTSLPLLPVGAFINIHAVTAAALPVTHTCFSQLDLSENPPAIIHTKEGFERFLTDAIGMTGFTMA